MLRKCAPSPARRRAAFVGVLAVAALLAPPGAARAFEPQRTFPDTRNGIYVFVDQLGSLSTAQRQFAAAHYVGTQKQTSGLIDAIRAYDPNFIMLQYRLGVRESGYPGGPVFIHDNTWCNDWGSINPNEDWFIHDDDGNRVYQLYGGSVYEYCMDISGAVNGNTTNGWKEYWSACVIDDCDDSHADGVFADSTHLPYAVPADLWDSPIGGPPHTPYIPHMETFYDYTYQQFDQAGKYFIPNIGGLCTTVDTTAGYYEDVHGAMVEGFATKLSNYDWKLQQNRTLRLLGNDKIYIAQSGVSGHTDIEGRRWLMSNFLLLKHDRSFINICGAGSQMHWWPEYDLDLGAPDDPDVPGDVDDLQVAGGLYARGYAHGVALVNPASGQRTWSLPDDGNAWFLVTPYGGGRVLSDGQIERDSGLTFTRQADDVAVDGWSGTILVKTALGDAQLDWTVDVLDLAILANHFGEVEATWFDGDFNGDGVVDVLDLAVVANNFGAGGGAGGGTVPEPGALLLLAVGAAGAARRRRRPAGSLCDVRARRPSAARGPAGSAPR